MESGAWDNYKALAEQGILVVILDYCAYHSWLLVCNHVQKFTPLGRYNVDQSTTAGSGTPLINLDLRKLRTLEEFLVAAHEMVLEDVEPLCAKAKAELFQKLPVRHHRRSPNCQVG